MVGAVDHYKDVKGTLGVAEGAIEVAFSLQNLAHVVGSDGHRRVNGPIGGFKDLQGTLGIGKGAIELVFGLKNRSYVANIPANDGMGEPIRRSS
jgi:hypothetical protein